MNVADTGLANMGIGLAARLLSSPSVVYTDEALPDPNQFSWWVDSGDDRGYIRGGSITKLSPTFPYGYTGEVEPDNPP
jgi:hypothetical protein